MVGGRRKNFPHTVVRCGPGSHHAGRNGRGGRDAGAGSGNAVSGGMGRTDGKRAGEAEATQGGGRAGPAVDHSYQASTPCREFPRCRIWLEERPMALLDSTS
ncbi:MAG: hypothetical protein AMXMBFR55_01770 [Gemmatimonadota bacterium]